MQGHKQTQETKNKIIKSLKEQWRTGKRTAPRPKGFKMSEETKRKIGLANSISLKGKKPSLEARKKISKTLMGHKQSKETREKIGIGNSISLKGRKMPIEVRLKISKSHKGKKSHLWRGGITKINHKIRDSIEYRLWREAIFKRDNFTCVWCGIKGGKLNADHIKPFAYFPELRFSIDNGRTLCVSCHRKTDTWGKRSYPQLEGYIPN